MPQLSGEPHLDAARLGVGHVRDTHGSRPIARRIGQQCRRFEALDQPLVAVGRGVGEGVERPCVLDYAANVVERHFRQTTVLLTAEQVFTVLQQRLVHVGAVAVVIHQRLGHERCRLAVTVRHVHERVLEDLHRIGLFDQGVESHADFTLAGGGDLMVMNLGHQTHLLQCKGRPRSGYRACESTGGTGK